MKELVDKKEKEAAARRALLESDSSSEEEEDMSDEDQGEEKGKGQFLCPKIPTASKGVGVVTLIKSFCALLGSFQPWFGCHGLWSVLQS